MDPVQNAITQAIDASEAENNKAADDAAAAAAANNDGAGGAGDDAGAGTGDDNQGGDNNAELVLDDVLAVEAADLDDAQKAFLVENKDDLTGKQIKAYTDAGISFEADDKPVKGDGANIEATKPHEVPADDSDLVLEVEDAEGNKFKITKISDLPTDFMYKDSRQPLEVIDGLNDLKTKKAERAKLREENDTIQDSNSTRERVANLWNTEVGQMQADGTLPTGTIDWEKGEYPNAAAKEQIEGLFSFMTEENMRREKAGQPYVVSLRDVVVLKADADAKAAAKSGKNKDGKTPEQLAQEAKDAQIKKDKARKIAASNGDNQNADADDKPTYVKGSGKSITDITEEMINQAGA